MDIELSVDIVHVRVYGSDGDDQIASDIAHGTVMGKHDDDLVLAWGESIGCGNGVAALANTFVVNKLCWFFVEAPKSIDFSVIDHPEGDPDNGSDNDEGDYREQERRWVGHHADGFPCERSQCKTNAIAGYTLGEKRASRYLDSPNDLTEKREERQDKVIDANLRDRA